MKPKEQVKENIEKKIESIYEQRMPGHYELMLDEIESEAGSIRDYTYKKTNGKEIITIMMNDVNDARAAAKNLRRHNIVRDMYSDIDVQFDAASGPKVIVTVTLPE